MRGKQLKIILAVSGCLIIATAFNNCGNPIGSPILLKAASSGGQIGDGQCFTLPAAKPGPITRLAAQPMVSPFSSQKVVVASQNETSNDYVALVSHNCLRGQNASTRADLFSAKVSSRATAVTEETSIWPHVFRWSEEDTDGSLMSRLNADPCIVGVSPNLPYRRTALQGPPIEINDTFFDLQDHLAKLFFDDVLNLFYNWNTINDVTRPIKVAVIDTGAMYEHPDLAANMFRGPNGIGVDATTLDRAGVDPVYDGTDMDEFVFHGTHVSGIIAAVGGNSIGVSGLAPQGVKILPANVFYLIEEDTDDDGVPEQYVASDSATVIKGILWAVSEQVDVINMSLGGPQADPAMLAALQQAVQAGIFIAVAAGNADESTPAQELNNNFRQFPASYAAQIDGMMAVGSVDSQTLTRSSFSHFGVNAVEMSAFGHQGGGTGIASTFDAQDYARLSGTSQASPQVAAAGAMIMGLYQSGLNRKPAPAEVENLLKTTAQKIPALTNTFRDGNLLDVKAAAIQVYRQNAAAFDACP